MKKNFFKWYMFAFLFISNFVMFADPGGVDPEDGGTDDTTGFPLNAKLVWLAVAGVAFAFYYTKKIQSKKAA